MRAWTLLALIALSACGIADSTLLTELDAEQGVAVCAEYDARTVTCGEGDATWTNEFSTDCAAQGADRPAGCPATVGDYRACYDAYDAMTDDQVCADDLPAACSALLVEACITADAR